MFGIPQSVTVGWRSADDDDSRLIRKFNNWVNWPFSFFFFFFFLVVLILLIIIFSSTK
jgi:hypothetical protein